MVGVEQPSVNIFRGLNIAELKIDQAYVNISEQFEHGDLPYYVYLRSENCIGCPFTKPKAILLNQKEKKVN